MINFNNKNKLCSVLRSYQWWRRRRHGYTRLHRCHTRWQSRRQRRRRRHRRNTTTHCTATTNTPRRSRRSKQRIRSLLYPRPPQTSLGRQKFSMRIRRGQHAFRTTPVPFRHTSRTSSSLGDHIIPFPGGERRSLLKRVLHRDLSIAQILIVHTFNSQITRLKRIKAHESKPLTLIRHIISHNLRRFNNRPKRREGIIQQLLIHIARIQIPNE
mmetsp:Transcript_24334/g.43873  ORF Transcript_24334/g.43873 Transcript_24334/m.43873 type:complete len:213 (-) Transcript_24334:354-992(-)